MKKIAIILFIAATPLYGASLGTCVRSLYDLILKKAPSQKSNLSLSWVRKNSDPLASGGFSNSYKFSRNGETKVAVISQIFDISDSKNFLDIDQYGPQGAARIRQKIKNMTPEEAIEIINNFEIDPQKQTIENNRVLKEVADRVYLMEISKRFAHLELDGRRIIPQITEFVYDDDGVPVGHIMDFVEGDTLDSFIKNCSSRTCFDQAIEYVNKISNQLAELYRHQIDEDSGIQLLHGDAANFRNIIVDRNGNATLIDFSFDFALNWFANRKYTVLTEVYNYRKETLKRFQGLCTKLNLPSNCAIGLLKLNETFGL